MGFFDSVTKTENPGSFEMSTALELIPHDTNLLSAAEEAKWDVYDGDNYVKLKWRAMAPEQYKNRVVFQRLKLEDQNPDVAKKARDMLFAIDYNAGGKLSAANVRPTDEMLAAALMHKPMVIKMGIYENKKKDKDGKEESKKYNYVMAVAPRNANAAHAAPAAQARPATTPPPAFMGGFDDDIPFN
jgi:hypothetical protein